MAKESFALVLGSERMAVEESPSTHHRTLNDSNKSALQHEFQLDTQYEISPPTAIPAGYLVTGVAYNFVVTFCPAAKACSVDLVSVFSVPLWLCWDVVQSGSDRHMECVHLGHSSVDSGIFFQRSFEAVASCLVASLQCGVFSDSDIDMCGESCFGSKQHVRTALHFRDFVVSRKVIEV